MQALGRVASSGHGQAATCSTCLSREVRDATGRNLRDAAHNPHCLTTMPLVAGARLGPYEIEAAIGAGGMGEVYRARDTKLHRDVALKVLPDAFANDPDRLARFEREAQVLASLNHPHIAAIYGVEDAGSTRALVLEFVPGDTLADRIVRGHIPINETLAIARQIALALEAAHEHGIVHRDLKPSNIKVRDDGTVKVLDFGLAKALDTVTGVSGRSQSPTLTSPAMTQAGVVLGTAAYMSPEQARGQNADKRSDVWAFGCVLYEMLTGTPPFAGDTVSDLVASVLRSDPDWSRLPSPLAPSIVTLVKRCLEKDRSRRIADASVATFILNEPLVAEPDDRPAMERAQMHPWGWRQLAALGAAGVVGAVGAGAIVWYARPAVEPPRVSRLTITPPQTAPFRSTSGANLKVAISPDGMSLVYPDDGGTLSLRRLDSLEATPLTGLGAPIDPFFSPDGQWIGFFNTNNSIQKVAVTGGLPMNLVALGGAASRGATWSDTGLIIFATTAASGLQTVPASGGHAEVLTTPDREKGEGDHVLPQMLPRGRGVLFTILPATGGLDRAQAAVLDLTTKTYKVILRGGSQARYLPTGHLVYAAGATLRAVPFDLDTLEVATSPPIPVLSHAAAASGAANFDVSANGTLVYVTGQGDAPTFKLVWVDRQGHEEVLAAPPRSYLYPRLSPDGTRVALDIRDQDNDIWTWDLQRETLTRVTIDPGLERFPLWTSDGQRLIFSSDRLGESNVFVQTAIEVGKSQRLLESPIIDVPMSVSRDGRRLVLRRNFDLMLLTLNDRDEPAGPIQPLVQTPFQEVTGVLSPDDKWLAYGSDESGTFEIYVRPFPDVRAGRSQVSRGGGAQPVWSRDGRELFFFASTGELMSRSARDRHGPPARRVRSLTQVTPAGISRRRQPTTSRPMASDF
ncbi:MAG TPA: protein kinase [Vicinamibacterales bacterium]|nr:protein kinase [Vicinamibacterales bacterium]